MGEIQPIEIDGYEIEKSITRQKESAILERTVAPWGPQIMHTAVRKVVKTIEIPYRNWISERSESGNSNTTT